MEKKERILLIFTIILSLTLLLIIIHFLQIKEYLSLLWMCYIGLTLIIIGIIKRNSNLILSQVIILLIPNIIWTIYFIIGQFTNTTIGISENFINLATLPLAILSLLHIYTIVFALIALAIIKLKRSYKALLISFIEVVIIFIIMVLIPGNPGVNCWPTPVNCASITLPEFIPYPIFLLLSAFTFVIVSYFIITSMPIFKRKKSN